jgi:hypothetical protein
MPKTNGAIGKAHTHFETVPLEVVRVIAVEDLPTEDKAGAARDIVELPVKKNLLMPVPTRAPAGKKRRA